MSFCPTELALLKKTTYLRIWQNIALQILKNVQTLLNIFLHLDARHRLSGKYYINVFYPHIGWELAQMWQGNLLEILGLVQKGTIALFRIIQ